jgi:hypothetical protein
MWHRAAAEVLFAGMSGSKMVLVSSMVQATASNRSAMVAAVGLLLAALHGVEAAIWAAAYLWLGALDTPSDAILYSVDSMTTRGASGLTLQRHWQMMGAL